MFSHISLLLEGKYLQTKEMRHCVECRYLGNLVPRVFMKEKTLVEYAGRFHDPWNRIASAAGNCAFDFNSLRFSSAKNKYFFME